MALKIRRGIESERSGKIFELGELIWVTNTQKLYIGDGVTAGGVDILAQSAGSHLTYNGDTGLLDVTFNGVTTSSIGEGTNLYYTAERAQDAVGSALVAGNGFNTGITFTYDDVNNRITAIVSGAAFSGNLAGDLVLNNHNINGTGNINITGNITNSGTLTVTTGLGANLPLNTKNINGTGNIDITGNIIATGTLAVTTGLNRNLSLNSYSLEGTGGINIGGVITATSSTANDGIVRLVGVSAGATTNATLKIRSSRASNTSIANGDYVGNLTFEAYNGTDDVKSVIIQPSVTSTLSAGYFTTNLTFYVLNQDSYHRPFNMRGDGVFETTGLKLFAADTATIGTITTAEAAVAYNTDTKSLQVNTGSGYKTIPTFVGVPASTGASGKTGQISADANYVYVCYASDSWIRVNKDATW